MREITSIFLITLTSIAAASLIFSCKSTKTPIAMDQVLLITLKDNLSGKYISENYQTYSPSEIKRSNKTLNQYRAIFNCNEDNFNRLQEKLSSDDKVTNYKNQKSDNDIQTGKNDKRVKTKPIKNKK